MSALSPLERYLFRYGSKFNLRSFNYIVVLLPVMKNIGGLFPFTQLRLSSVPVQ